MYYQLVDKIMSLIIPERRVKDIISSGVRSRQFSNEECFYYALQLIDFAIKAEENSKNPVGALTNE